MSDSEFDSAMAELREQCRRMGAYGVDVYIRPDGRVEFDFCLPSDRNMRIIRADLNPGGSDPTPNLALHAVLDGWCGR